MKKMNCRKEKREKQKERETTTRTVRTVKNCHFSFNQNTLI